MTNGLWRQWSAVGIHRRSLSHYARGTMFGGTHLVGGGPCEMRYCARWRGKHTGTEEAGAAGIAAESEERAAGRVMLVMAVMAVAAEDGAGDGAAAGAAVARTRARARTGSRAALLVRALLVAGGAAGDDGGAVVERVEEAHGCGFRCCCERGESCKRFSLFVGGFV